MTIVQYSCTVVRMSIVCTLKDGELGVYCLLFMERASEQRCLLYYTMDIEGKGDYYVYYVCAP